MISFQTSVAVPSHIIDKIGVRIRELVVNEMLIAKHRYEIWKQEDIWDIETLINNAVKTYANSEQKSCEGWTLNANTVEEIAEHLRQHRWIAAIKEFRSATGSGLAEAKYFLDKFGRGSTAAIEFKNTFV